MTMKHFDTGNHTKITVADMEHYTRHVPDTLDPTDRVVSHYEAILPYTHNNTQKGAVFEACVFDMLVFFGVGITDTHVDMVKGYNAEADVVVSNDGHVYALLVKTSLRERWKQIDRDALVMAPSRGPNVVIPVCLFYREKAGDDDIRMLDLARKKEDMAFCKVLEYVPILHHDSLADLIEKMGGDPAVKRRPRLKRII